MPLEYVLGPRVVTPLTPSNGVSIRLADDARKCVVFFGFKDGDKITYRGTGFLVRVEEGSHRPTYLVTARHVAKQLDKTGFVIRANDKHGKAVEDEPEIVDWELHPDPSVDVAVAAFRPPEEFDVTSILIGRFVSEDVRKEVGNVGPGSLTHVVGLFRLHSGEDRHLPMVHTGAIALEAIDGETVPIVDRVTKEKFHTEAYLVEAQTLDGLSGSPVFTRRTLQAGRMKGYGPVVFLLGVWIGSWPGVPDKVIADDRGLDGSERVPVGMGLVAPADKIRDILMGKKFKDARRKNREQDELDRAATQDSAPPTTEDNPSHKEDFSSLLDAAVQTPKQDG